MKEEKETWTRRAESKKEATSADENASAREPEGAPLSGEPRKQQQQQQRERSDGRPAQALDARGRAWRGRLRQQQ